MDWNTAEAPKKHRWSSFLVKLVTQDSYSYKLRFPKFSLNLNLILWKVIILWVCIKIFKEVNVVIILHVVKCLITVVLDNYISYVKLSTEQNVKISTGKIVKKLNFDFVVCSVNKRFCGFAENFIKKLENFIHKKYFQTGASSNSSFYSAILLSPNFIFIFFFLKSNHN